MGEQTRRLEILVVEDNPQHIADVKRFLDGRIQSGVGLSVDYAENLQDAREKLQAKRYDGIMSDVLFPSDHGQDEKPNGIEIATYALDNTIPFVLVTDRFHHGYKVDGTCNWLREHASMEMIDTRGEYNKGNADAQTPHKNWSGAYLTLMYSITTLANGVKDQSQSRCPWRQLPICIPLSLEYVRNYLQTKKEESENIPQLTGEDAEWLEGRLEEAKRSGRAKYESDSIFANVVDHYCKGMEDVAYLVSE